MKPKIGKWNFVHNDPLLFCLYFSLCLCVAEYELETFIIMYYIYLAIYIKVGLKDKHV